MIKAKYYRIVNKIKHTEFIIKPCILMEVLPPYYRYIHEILIVKEFEDAN
jgi:hypothetical protein